MEDIGIVKDIAYITALVLSVGSVYWKNEMDKVKIKSRLDNLEHDNTGQAKKMESISNSLDEIKQMLHEHLAFHKGKESKN